MKKLKIIILLLTSFVLSNTYGGTMVHPLTIQKIATGWGQEGIYITVNESIPPVEGCSDPRYFMPRDNLMFKESVSIMLSAFHAGSRVAFFVTGCNSSLKVHKITAVDIFK